MLWVESVQMFDSVENIMATTSSTKTPFGILCRKSKIIHLLSEFGRIAYITKRENLKKQMK